MARISLNQIRKEFDRGNVVAVDDSSLETDGGEFLSFVAPSGCGKSTTLRCIVGLEDVTAGDLTIGNVRVNDLTSRQRNIMTFDESGGTVSAKRIGDGSVRRQPEVTES